MGKYSNNGPDWTDVEMLMRAIGSIHSGVVGLTVLPRGTGATGGVSVGASIMLSVLPGSPLPEYVTTVKDWPCNAHADFAAHCFGALHELDFAISKVYQQEELWK